VLTTHYLEEAEQLCSRIGMLKAGRMVALDSTRNLLENFSGLQLELTLDRDTLPEGVRATVVAADSGHFTLRLRDYAELEQLLRQLREAGVAIRELELDPTDLRKCSCA
jgi:ABC-2 type transport system ATP-binding protein